MREFDEILNNPKIKAIFRKVKNDKAIQLKMEVHSYAASDKCLVKFTSALGWEHLSVSHKNKIPSWNTMQEMKEMFWDDEEVCFQLHPAKSEYINNNEYTLHIWKPIDREFETPPSILVGFREGHEGEDREVLKKLQEELGNPLNDRDIDVLINPKELETMQIGELLHYASKYM